MQTFFGLNDVHLARQLDSFVACWLSESVPFFWNEKKGEAPAFEYARLVRIEDVEARPEGLSVDVSRAQNKSRAPQPNIERLVDIGVPGGTVNPYIHYYRRYRILWNVVDESLELDSTHPDIVGLTPVKRSPSLRNHKSPN
jgi:hypothetical protein